MVPYRIGLCPLCDDIRRNHLFNGLCQYHYFLQQRAAGRGIDRRLLPDRRWSGPADQDILLDLWYEDQVRNMPDHCFECGDYIVKGNYRFAKAAIAHILPKKDFLSVMNHPRNALILGGACGCHHRWDSSWSAARQMKVAERAKEQFEDLIRFLELAELHLVPDFLVESWRLET